MERAKKKGYLSSSDVKHLSRRERILPFISVWICPGGQALPGSKIPALSSSFRYSLTIIPDTRKQAFFSSGRVIPQFTLSFASQKRTKAFYSSMENASFTLNLSEWAYLEKMCRKSPVSARDDPKNHPGRSIEALKMPGWRGQGYSPKSI